MVFCLFPDKADSCTINDVTFLKQFEVITVNSSGQLKVFDLRQTDDDPTKSFSVYVSSTSLLPYNIIQYNSFKPGVPFMGHRQTQ